MDSVCIVKIETIFRQQIQQRIQAQMPQLTIMNRAFIHFKDMRLPGVRKCVFDTDPSAGSDQRAGGSNTFDKLSTGNLQVGEPPDSNKRDSILKNYTGKVNNTMKIMIVIT
jgi:hypothetical protein